MSRTKASQPLPMPPDPFEAWGDVPTDRANERKRIARLLPRISNYWALMRRLGETSHWLNWQLHERNRLNLKSLHSSLGALHAELEASYFMLDRLGPDAKAALARRAEMQKARPRGDSGETIWQWLEQPNLPVSGRERIEWVMRAVADCSRWAVEAQVGIEIPKVVIEPPDPETPDAPSQRSGGGRPRDVDAEEAMLSLMEIWEAQTGERPTIATDPASGRKKTEKPFLAFCEAVLVPIYFARGLKPPSIGALGQKMVYSNGRSSRAKMKSPKIKSD